MTIICLEGRGGGRPGRRQMVWIALQAATIRGDIGWHNSSQSLLVITTVYTAIWYQMEREHFSDWLSSFWNSFWHLVAHYRHKVSPAISKYKLSKNCDPLKSTVYSLQATLRPRPKNWPPLRKDDEGNGSWREGWRELHNEILTSEGSLYYLL